MADVRVASAAQAAERGRPCAPRADLRFIFRMCWNRPCEERCGGPLQERAVTAPDRFARATTQAAFPKEDRPCSFRSLPRRAATYLLASAGASAASAAGAAADAGEAG